VAPAGPDPAILSGMPLLRGVPTRELEWLAPFLYEGIFPAGASVLSIEQPGEAVYAILSGSVKVSSVHPDGSQVVLAVLGPGEEVGEMSLADSFGRSSDVVILEEPTFLWMDGTTFRSNVTESPLLVRNLAEIFSKRLRVANRTPDRPGDPRRARAGGLPASAPRQGTRRRSAYRRRKRWLADTHAPHPNRPGRLGGRLAGQSQPSPRRLAQAQRQLGRQ
jgi:CRP-like cAMP-binding protein